MESVIEFKLPALGENIEQGDLVRLLIAPGAAVSEGQAVMELETDKAVVEVPSSVNGTVKEVLVKEGQKIKVGQVIFTADSNGAAAAAGENPHPAESAADTVEKLQPPAQTAPDSPPGLPPARSTDASPAGQFRLQELGENISQGDLVRLMIAPGARVSEGQPVMELETDKAVVEVPSTVSGIVNEVRVKEGEKIKVGQVIFTLQGGDGSPAGIARPQRQPVEHVSGQHGARLAFQAAIRAEGKTEEQALPPDQPMPRPAAFSMPIQLGKVAGTEHREAVPAAPHTRRLARELGVDIYEV
jgi:pyruvate dehydrogenase E2 component (dihydrolipoamide acetyltransferase)